MKSKRLTVLHWFSDHFLSHPKSAQGQKNAIAWTFGILAFLFVVSLAYVSWRDFSQTKTAAVDSTSGLAVALEEHTERSLEAVELTLETIARDLAGIDITNWQPGREEWEKYRALAMRLPQVSSYAVFDRNGDSRLITTDYPWPRLSAVDREYFTAHRDQGVRTNLGSTFIARFNGKPIFTYGIRLEDSRGNFNGVLLASLELGYFRHFYRSLNVGPNGSIAIIRADGKTILREPLSVANRFRDLSTDKLFTELLPKSPVGSFNNSSPFDGQDRLAAYRASKARPFVVVAAKSEAELFRPVWMRFTASSAALAVVLALMYMLARFLIGNIEREARHRAELAASRDFADAILDSVTSHIVIVDGHGIVRRTNRAWRMFAQENGYQSDPSFIGQDYLGVVKSVETDTMQAVHEGICAVMDRRRSSFQAEYPCHSPLEERWFNMRVSPLDHEAGSVVIVHENVSRLKQMEEKFRALATRDELTGLSNRLQFREVLERAVHGATRLDNRQSIALLFIDLDGFKQVNDALGHEAGDHLLKEFGRRLLTVVRKTDTVARLGGDEFVILLEHLAGAQADVGPIAEKVLEMAVTPYDYLGHACRVSASIGVAVFDGKMSADEFLSQADDAMYAAKQSGKNRWALHQRHPRAPQPHDGDQPASVQEPALPPDEAERLGTLRATGLLDSMPEEMFDRITRLASALLNVPTALFTLVDEDRQWFKSRQGFEATYTPRNISFCAHAILDDVALIVSDALKDARFAGNPLVTHGPQIRFYAGMPIHAAGRRKIGTLCLIDYVPRTFGRREVEILEALAGIVEELVANRHARLALADESGIEVS